LTRDAIFYLLKIQNFIGIKIPYKYFLLGLEVCFLTQDEVEKMLNYTGFKVIEKHTHNYKLKQIEKVMGVKNISYVDWLAEKPI
jgi:hypothetical protein